MRVSVGLLAEEGEVLRREGFVQVPLFPMPGASGSGYTESLSSVFFEGDLRSSGWLCAQAACWWRVSGQNWLVFWIPQ